jgi:hypothetical protein
MTTFCFEDIPDIKKRMNFYKRIEEISNHTITVGFSQDKGLYCVALEDISSGQKTMRIPKNLTISPYYLFPFKFEIFNALNSIPIIKDSVGKEQKMGSYLLTFYVLYLMKADKKLIRQYIIENNITDYLNVYEVDETVLDSFPNMILTGSTIQNEEIRLMRDLGYPLDKENEFETVLKNVYHYIRTTPHGEYIFPWISQIDEFRNAFGLVMSRAMTLMINEYKILDGINTYSLKGAEKKNFEINNYISQVVGVPCIVTFVDLCNHHQPKYIDLRDKHQIILDTEKGYYINSVAFQANAGEEIAFTYSNDPSNIILFLHYGMIFKKNYFNTYKINIDEAVTLNINQFNLCREVGCFDSSVKDPLNIPKSRYYSVRLGELNSDLLNFARIKHLKGEINFSKIMRSLTNEKPITFENEIRAFAYYLKNSNHAPFQKIPTQRIIRKIQKQRNYLNRLERDRLANPEEFDLKLWRRYKTFEQIYSLDLYYRNVIFNHKNLALGRLIKNLNGSVNDLKKKKYVKNK